MVEPGDQEFLRSIFLMEAWDTFAAIEQGITRLIRGEEPAWDELFLVLHRLTGAAALQGFGPVAAMAERMDQTLRPLRNDSAEARALVAPRLGEQVASLKAALDAIEQGAERRACRAGAAKGPGRPRRPAPAAPRGGGAGGPAPAGGPGGGPRGRRPGPGGGRGPRRWPRGGGGGPPWRRPRP